MTVAMDSTTEVAIPVLHYMAAEDVGKIAFDEEMRGRTGLAEVAYGYQAANVEDAPDAHVTVSAFRSSNGTTFHTSFTDASGTLGGKRLVRPVAVCKLTSGSTLATACVGGVMYIIEP